MARVLTEDVERLRPRLGSRNPQDAVSDEEEMSRRLYVRAIFARIEALVEQHKRLLLHLTKANVITLPAGAARVYRSAFTPSRTTALSWNVNST